MIPLSLYIHFPWCVQKCPYCDFNSHKAPPDISYNKNSQSPSLQASYVQALMRDIEFILPYIWGRRVSSIFIGGGTPSLMNPDSLDWLFSNLRSHLTISPNAEITMEANPGTADQANFKAYKDIGINRLSIGVQSFSDDHLKSLGRIHNASQATGAFEMARKAGFEQINLDLMFGLPTQNLEQSLSDLRQAILLNPNHISHYQLTLEPNTLFHRYQPVLPDDELIESMQIEGQALLRQAGYEQYEVSAYAQRNSRCAHNINYWQYGDYIGIGAGAHGKITLQNEQKIYRTSIKKHPTDYLKYAGTNASFDAFKVVDHTELPFEFMLNTLRLKEGVPKGFWQQRTFLGDEVIDAKVRDLKLRNLLSVNPNDQLCATDRGFLYLNQILAEFIEDEDKL